MYRHCSTIILLCIRMVSLSVGRGKGCSTPLEIPIRISHRNCHWRHSFVASLGSITKCHFFKCITVALPKCFSAALSLLNLLENSLGRSKPATRLMEAQQHTVWNISTIFKPYWAAFYRNKMSTTRCEWVRLFISWQSSLPGPNVLVVLVSLASQRLHFI